MLFLSRVVIYLYIFEGELYVLPQMSVVSLSRRGRAVILIFRNKIVLVLFFKYSIVLYQFFTRNQYNLVSQSSPLALSFALTISSLFAPNSPPSFVDTSVVELPG